MPTQRLGRAAGHSKVWLGPGLGVPVTCGKRRSEKRGQDATGKGSEWADERPSKWLGLQAVTRGKVRAGETPGDEA